MLKCALSDPITGTPKLNVATIEQWRPTYYWIWIPYTSWISDLSFEFCAALSAKPNACIFKSLFIVDFELTLLLLSPNAPGGSIGDGAKTAHEHEHRCGTTRESRSRHIYVKRMRTSCRVWRVKRVCIKHDTNYVLQWLRNCICLAQNFEGLLWN